MKPRHDSYYALPGTDLDCLDVIDALGLNFQCGNAMKYLWRAGKKSPDVAEDLKKAIVYLEREVERLAES